MKLQELFESDTVTVAIPNNKVQEFESAAQSNFKNAKTTNKPVDCHTKIVVSTESPE